MSLFEKPVYEEVYLPFRYILDIDEILAAIVTIEAYGNILDEYKYCVASFYTTIDQVNDITQMLRYSEGKRVRIVLKIKNGKVKRFKIDLNSLAEAYGDDRFRTLEMTAWGINDKSIEETNRNYNNAERTE